MGFCNRILTDREIYDQQIFITDIETAIPLGITTLPVGSVLDLAASTVTASVVECDLIKTPLTITGANITLDIQKNLVITPPSPAAPIPVAFSLRKVFPVTFSKITEAFIDIADIPKAECRISGVTAVDELTLIILPTPAITETLQVSMYLVVVVPDKLLVPACKSDLTATATLSIGLIP